MLCEINNQCIGDVNNSKFVDVNIVDKLKNNIDIDYLYIFNNDKTYNIVINEILIELCWYIGYWDVNSKSNIDRISKWDICI